MITWLRGILLRREPDRVVLDVGGVGYEVLLPAIVSRLLEEHPIGQPLALEIYYAVSERNPRPQLIGFLHEHERRFFEELIKVSGLGPNSAARALSHPVSRVAAAIEAGDAAFLQRLDGVGGRTAEKIVASLRGKVGVFALLQDEQPVPAAAGVPDLAAEALAVLSQLGYRRAEAQRMVEEALRAGPAPASTEELIQRVYRFTASAAAGSGFRVPGSESGVPSPESEDAP